MKAKKKVTKAKKAAVKPAGKRKQSSTASVPAKKATAKIKAKAVGKVIHYYDKIGVAIIKLAVGLKVGDTIKIARKDGEMEQVVKSMQVEHEAISKAKKGDVIGLKVKKPVKEGAKVTM